MFVLLFRVKMTGLGSFPISHVNVWECVTALTLLASTVDSWRLPVMHVARNRRSNVTCCFLSLFFKYIFLWMCLRDW